MTAKQIFWGIIIILALLLSTYGIYTYSDLKSKEYESNQLVDSLKLEIAYIEGDKKVLKIQVDNANDKIMDLQIELANIEPQTVKIITKYKEATPTEKKVIVSKAVEQMKKEMRGIGF
jgi:hypothetical protein